MSAADRLQGILDTVPARLAAILDGDAARREQAGRWSKKEILGHLIDSASNNHQRFVRLMLAPSVQFPEYQQESWVSAQNYASEPWSDLVQLWEAYNRHLLHILKGVPDSSLTRVFTPGSKQPMAFAQLIDGYVDHLEHHLADIIGAAS